MTKYELNLPQGSLSLSKEHKEKIVVVAGGRMPEENWLKAVAGAKRIFCADHGIDYCCKAGILPEILFGDKDSGCVENWQHAEKAGTDIRLYGREKDDTDLQLLLRDIPPESFVLATGIWGGRFDHLYANIFSLWACKKQKEATVILADHEEVMVLLGQGESVTFTPGKLPTEISLLPFTEENIVSICGVKWPLNKAVLTQNRPYAISNELVGRQVTAVCEAGGSGFYLKFSGTVVI